MYKNKIQNQIFLKFFLAFSKLEYFPVCPLFFLVSDIIYFAFIFFSTDVFIYFILSFEVLLVFKIFG